MLRERPVVFSEVGLDQKAYTNGFAVFEDPPVLQKNGEFNMPQGPGLGISINKEMIIS